MSSRMRWTRLASIASWASARSSSRSWSWSRSSACSTHCREAGTHFGLVAVADGLDQQIAQRLALELELAEHVEDLAAEGLAGLLQLLQQLAVDIAFAGFLGHQVPEVADFGLADAVDAAEALLDAVGVPRQVVVDHQVGALEVDAFARGVRGKQHLHLGVVLERLLRLHALLAAHAAVDHDHGLLAAEQRGDAVLKIVQRVAVLGEDDELLVRRGHGRRDRAGAVGRSRFGHAVGDGGGGEDLAQQACQFAPLGVLAAAADAERERFQAFQRLDLSLQLGDGARRGGLIEDLLLGGLDLVVRRIFQILDVFGVQHRQRRRRAIGAGLAAALEQFQLAQPAFQPLAAAAQRLVDGLGRGGQPPLQDGERKADGAGALVVLRAPRRG